MFDILAGAYGNGSYFAKNANYSHDVQYAEPEDVTNVRHMFYCRCLTGDYVESGYGAKMPPTKQGLVSYDTTVNHKRQYNDTIMFVVYNPDQVYPQYLIKYKDGYNWTKVKK